MTQKNAFSNYLAKLIIQFKVKLNFRVVKHLSVIFDSICCKEQLQKDLFKQEHI